SGRGIARRAANDLEPRLLIEVVGRLAVRLAQEKAVQRSAMACVEIEERPGVAGLEAQHQLGVVAPAFASRPRGGARRLAADRFVPLRNGVPHDRMRTA